jgi:glycosyltransferase involved in cell wall biosynthesis
MLLSVIVPVYNSEKYLTDCVNSIINQTYKKIELILVNDGSTDRSFEICKKFSENYSNVKVFSIENRGSAYARNYGLKKANGDYISFIDSDDWIDSTMFEKLASIVIDKKIDIVSCNLIHVKNNGSQIKEVSNNRGDYYSREQIINEIFPVLINSSNLSQQEWPMRMVTKLYNRRFLDSNEIKFENTLKAAQDFVFSVTAMYYANSFYYLKNEYLYYYRENFESRTHRHLNRAWDNYLCMNNYLKLLLNSSKDYDFTNQLELSKLHGVLSSISYVYRAGNKNGFFNKYKYTKEFSSHFNLDKATSLLDWNRTPIKKRIFSYLLKKRMYFTVSFLANFYYLLVYRTYKRITR